MKIAFSGLNLPEGKVKYKDEILVALEKKFEPLKVTPFFAEFIKGDFVQADAIAVERSALLDLLIIDMEKMEARAERSEDAAEKALAKKCLQALEAEKPLCDVEFTEAETTVVRGLAPVSLKPTFIVDGSDPDVNKLIRDVMDKAKVSFFYTAGKKEVRSWFINKGSDILTCAGKIHSDLARGFIKGDVVNFADFKDLHNLNEAKAKGVAKLVDRDYIMQEGDIIEIRFNV